MYGRELDGLSLKARAALSLKREPREEPGKVDVCDGRSRRGKRARRASGKKKRRGPVSFTLKLLLPFLISFVSTPA